MKPLLLPSTKIQSKGCTPKQKKGRFLGYPAERLQRKPLKKMLWCNRLCTSQHTTLHSTINLGEDYPFLFQLKEKIPRIKISLSACLHECPALTSRRETYLRTWYLPLPSTIFNRRAVPQNGKFLGYPAERLHKVHNKCYDDANLSTTPFKERFKNRPDGWMEVGYHIRRPRSLRNARRVAGIGRNPGKPSIESAHLTFQSDHIRFLQRLCACSSIIGVMSSRKELMSAVVEADE